LEHWYPAGQANCRGGPGSRSHLFSPHLGGWPGAAGEFARLGGSIAGPLHRVSLRPADLDTGTPRFHPAFPNPARPRGLYHPARLSWVGRQAGLAGAGAIKNFNRDNGVLSLFEVSHETFPLVGGPRWRYPHRTAELP